MLNLTIYQRKLAQKSLVKAVEIAGGQHGLARICGVKQPHVSWWLHRSADKVLPAEYVLRVEKALKGVISRYELRPDIYPVE